MSFVVIKNTDSRFLIKKHHLLNKQGLGSKYTVYDGGTFSPYKFECIACKNSQTAIDHLEVSSFDADKLKISADDLRTFGGTGTFGKLIQCQNCQTYFYIGFGLSEPNNGRDLIVIYTVLELEVFDV